MLGFDMFGALTIQFYWTVNGSMTDAKSEYMMVVTNGNAWDTNFGSFAL
jgi:hypothetical protein